MKSSFTLVTALLAQVLFSQLALAQSQDLNSEVDAEIEQMYKSSSNAQSLGIGNETKPQTSSAVVTQTIYVPQQAQQPMVQKQPETQVEGAPLSQSRADSMRRGRQDEELKTETRIVEKLEQSRLEDEKRRAAILFGDKFENMQNGQQQQAPQPLPTPPVQAVPVQAPSSQVQPIVINQNETLTRDAVREEVRAALAEDEESILPSMEQKYFTALAGVGYYPDADAIKGNYSLGAGFGTRFDYFLVEGSFVYSNYTVDALYLAQNYGYGSSAQYGSFDMNQYQGNIATKYQLLGGFVRPVVGGLISYSYREYVANQNTTYGPAGTDFGTSHAVDLGILAGVDFEFNNKMSFGVDMKYMYNMSSKISGTTVPGARSPEKLQYFTTGFFARVNF